MVPGFLLADTNPKAAGIFCLLLLLASHPCRALRFTHWLSQWNTRIQTSTDEHMMDYKYSGQDWRNMQHNVRWGHNAHCAHFKPTTKVSVSTFLWEKQKKQNKLAHLLIWCCSFRQTCSRMRSLLLFPCWLTQHSLDMWAAAWQAKLQVLSVCLCTVCVWGWKMLFGKHM